MERSPGTGAVRDPHGDDVHTGPTNGRTGAGGTPPDPLSVAVTGVSGFVGQHLLPLLDSSPDVGEVVGLDVREPARRGRRLVMRRVDLAGADLDALLGGVDVIVHLAGIVDPIPDDALMARVNVDGTRRLLEAAARAGVRRIVRISPAMVYGAWPTNPVPITEAAPLAPNPGYAPAVQAAEVERLVAEWRRGHPETVVTTLRAAPVLGAGADHLWARLLARGALSMHDATPPVQCVHADDLAAAVLSAATRDLPGVFNVAADGWLPVESAQEIRRSRWPSVPAGLAERALHRSWVTGLGDVPPSVVPYLVHPWVVANDRMRATGWAPAHGNEETLLETVDALPPRHLPPWVVPAALGGATVAALAGWAVVRALRGRERGWGRRRARRSWWIRRAPFSGRCRYR